MRRESLAVFRCTYDWTRAEFKELRIFRDLVILARSPLALPWSDVARCWDVCGEGHAASLAAVLGE
eukprot:10427305-Lingulodinium_polyedra.AAC.1